ncbi:MAG: DUF6443 domain-containing protein, partial [Bacteroidales bacterium]|nr:DUF6443 domain-containing protein [Bacteroidales bacterium]
MKNSIYPHPRNNFYLLLIWILPGLMLLAATAIGQPDYVVSNDIYTGQAEIGARQRVSLKKGFKALRGCQVRVFTDPSLNLPDHQYDPAPGNTIVGANPDNGLNYILTTTLRDRTRSYTQISETPHVQTVEYIDGLGRPLQTVIPMGSPQKKDIVTPISYDNAGRVDRQFLPYVSANASGAYNSEAIAQAISFYQNGTLQGREQDSKPYSNIRYDNSPLNRVTGEFGIGAAWENKPTTVNYKSNATAIAH